MTTSATLGRSIYLRLREVRSRRAIQRLIGWMMIPMRLRQIHLSVDHLALYEWGAQSGSFQLTASLIHQGRPSCLT